jgi:adenylate cyclase
MPASHAGPTEISFGKFCLDLRSRRLTRAGASVQLGGRAFDVLAVLAAAEGEVVGKNTILDQVWPSMVVEENNLQVQISTLRKVLGDDCIVNVPGRGYRLSAPAAAGPQEQPTRPTLAVLPFVNMSGDAGQDYLADALTEEITTALSRIRWFLVIARSSAFAYRGQAGIDLRDVGRALGARYLLEGSVRRSGKRVRMSGSLINAITGLRVWSDSYDAELDDLFALLDHLSEAVAGAIEPSLRYAEISRARARRTGSLDAFDLYLRALPLTWAATRESYEQAIAHLHRAIAVDPEFTVAKAFLAFTLMNQAGLGWGGPNGRADAVSLAAEALAANRDDPEVLQNAAHALAFFSRDYDQALAAVERALTISPHSVRTLMSAGWIRCYRVEPEPAIELFERALRLSPLDHEAGYLLSGLGLAHLMADNAARALPILLRSHHEMANWAPSLQFLVVAHQRLGQVDAAKEVAKQLMDVMPRLRARPAKWALRPGTFLDEMLAALRQAGIPP